MLFAADGAALLYDFQYCGKAPPTKDLAYALTCASNAPEQEAVSYTHLTLPTNREV